MDLYSLDPNTFKINGVCDRFGSLIWTERYSDAGDATLVIPATQANKIKYFEGMYLWTPSSREIAYIDTRLEEAGALTLTGQFLPDILRQRILRDSWSATNTAWKIVGAPGDVVATIVREMCMSGGLITTAVLPGSNGSYEPIPNLSIGPTPSGSSTTIAVDYGTVYDGVKQVCDAEGLGFTLYCPDISAGTAALIFLVYQGRDLTSGQNTYPVVAFDPALDSLSDTKELRSFAGYKTAAYAWPSNITDKTQIGSAFVVGTTTTMGMARRTLMVDASDIDATKYTAAELTTIMNRRAKNELVNNNYVRTTDGVIVPNNQHFTFGLDYKLGDIVELRGASNLATQARVTEYIRAQDNTGYTEYPTLTAL